MDSVFMDGFTDQVTLLDVPKAITVAAYCDWCRLPSILLNHLPILLREFKRYANLRLCAFVWVIKNTRLLGKIGVHELAIMDVLKSC